MNNMNFETALGYLKDGHHLARSGWNGEGMYIYLKKFDSYGYEPCIVMFTADNKHQPGWLASQADLLANDWGTCLNG